MNSPRVLMVTGAYYPEIAGGSLQCRSLVLALRDRVRFTVLTTTGLREFEGESVVDGLPVHRVFVDPESVRTKITAIWRMGRLALRLVRECDIFHFHGITEKMVLLFAVARLFARRTVEKLTSLGWDDPVAIRHRPLGGLLAAVQRRVDRIVAMNSALGERCRRAGIDAHKIVSIPNGVDTQRFSPVDTAARADLRKRFALPTTSVLVTFVGFWSREKGPDVLFDAWIRARRETGIDAALLFIGSTDASHPEVDIALVTAVKEQLRENQITDRVFFVERTDDVAAYLQASDIFALPSSREGLSNALLEAMSSGLACVTVDIPGATDGVIESGMNGRLIPADDTHALMQVLSEWFRDEGMRTAIGKRARETALSRFAMTDVANRYFSLYQELLGQT